MPPSHTTPLRPSTPSRLAPRWLGVTIATLLHLGLVGRALGEPTPTELFAGTNDERRCGTASHTRSELPLVIPQLAGDCSAAITNPDPAYIDGGWYELKLVFHVIHSADGSAGAVSDEQVHAQVAQLNDDFASRTGGNGIDTGIRFSLAAVTPDGGASSGITRHYDDQWFDDAGSYWEELSWDPSRYVNVYTSRAGGLLGYTFLPANENSDPGGSADRVVIHWQHLGVFGDDPANQGRTLTHEMGHYLGLDHTFAPNPTVPETFICGAAEAPECYADGDLLCDTPNEDAPSESCQAKTSCGTPDAIDNYMNYSPDACLAMFTREQQLRMRCSLLSYRPDAIWPAGRLEAVELPRENNLARHRVTLTNDSSEQHTFQLDITESAYPTAFESGESSLALELAPGDALETVLESQIPAQVGVDDVGLVQLSLFSDNNLQTATLNVAIAATPRGSLSLESTDTEVAAAFFSPGAWTFEVNNTSVIDDTYTLSLSGEGNAQFEENGASSLEIPVAAGQSLERAVLVTPHADATVGQRGELLLTAESTVSPDVRQTLPFEVEAGAYAAATFDVDSAEVIVMPGQAGDFTFLLGNNANQAQAYELNVMTTGPASATPEPTSTAPLAAFASTPSTAVDILYQVDDDALAGTTAQILVFATPQVPDNTEPPAALEEPPRLELSLLVGESGELEFRPRLTVLPAEGAAERDVNLQLANGVNARRSYRLLLESDSEVLSVPPQALSLEAFEDRMISLRLAKRDADAQEITRLEVTTTDSAEARAVAEVHWLSWPNLPDGGVATGEADDSGVAAADCESGPCEQSARAKSEDPGGCQCRFSTRDPRGTTGSALFAVWLVFTYVRRSQRVAR